MAAVGIFTKARLEAGRASSQCLFRKTEGARLLTVSMAATGSSSVPCHAVAVCKSHPVRFVHMVSMALVSYSHCPPAPLFFFIKFFLCFNSSHAWILPKHPYTCTSKGWGGPNKLQGCSTASWPAACPRPAMGHAPPSRSGSETALFSSPRSSRDPDGLR
ncbi:hypothetical protein HDV63DRAFT_82555 [Trichoderma sp. SZMC 28014]